jgi:hypothetical protein
MADELNLGATAEIVQQLVKNDEPRNNLIAKIDDAVNTVFEPDPAIKALPFVGDRHHAQTQIADARNTGVRTFAALLPKVEVQPLNDDPNEYERVDMAEQAMEWEFERMNRVGIKSIHEQIMEDAMSYHAVAFQTEYLPHKFKGKSTPRVKALLRERCFNWVRHPISTVHTWETDEGREAVAKVANYSAQDLILKFGKDNPGVMKILEKNQNKKPGELMNTPYTLVDWTDWENRAIWAIPGHNAKVVKSEYEFMNKRHEMPFIPWVVVNKGDPIWTAVLQSGMWENFQYTKLIEFAKAIELGTRSTYWIATPDGKLTNVWIDFSNPSNPIVTALDGTRIEGLPPIQIDPQLAKTGAELEQRISSSTVSQALSNLAQFSNATFSTVNQIVNMAIGQLSRAKNTAGDAEALGMLQGFEWIKFSKIPFTGYRTTSKDSKVEGGKGYQKGFQIVITHKDPPPADEVDKMDENEYKLLRRTVHFDLQSLYIKVNMQSNNAGDEQSRENVIINAVDKLNMSKKMAWDKMGWENFELAQAQRLEESMIEIELQAEAARSQMAVQMEGAQMQQQMQQQAEQQAMSQQAAQSDMSGGQQPTLQGADMRGGGLPAAGAAPNATREQVTGAARNGGQVQR